METTLQAPAKTLDAIERCKLLMTRLEQLAEQGVTVDNASILDPRGIDIYIAFADFQRLFNGGEVQVFRGDGTDILHSDRDADGVSIHSFRRKSSVYGYDREVISAPAADG